MLKRFLLAVLVAALLCAVAAGAEGAGMGLGQPLPDFTVETLDGGTFTLSRALEERDMVLINFWATWCRYCVMEFPYLQQAYEQYSDRVAVIALSVEPKDTREVMSAFAGEHGLSFPIGSGVETGMGQAFASQGIPVSIVVDRFGNVAFAQTGAQPSADAFVRLFEYFTDEDYTQTTVLTKLPPALPNVQAPDGALLSAAANAQGGTLEFHSAPEGAVWPMLCEEVDGRTALMSSNAGVDDSVCAVCLGVTAGEGDALAFAFKSSTETSMDMLFVEVDGETVKRFSGEHGWTDWAVPLQAGEHEIRLGYQKDLYGSVGEDRIWIDDVRVIPGDEAASALSALPATPVGEALDMRLLEPDARHIEFDQPQLVFGDMTNASAWIVPGESVRASVTLEAGDDPEAAYFFSSHDKEYVRLSDGLNEAGDGYEFTSGLNDAEYTLLYAYPSSEEQSRFAMRLLFTEEAAVDAFLEGSGIAWSYGD